jgi:hypothetical protein
MKKQAKKPLALSRETLRNLDNEKLVVANGAALSRTAVNMNCTNGLVNCSGVGCSIVGWSIGGGCF